MKQQDIPIRRIDPQVSSGIKLNYFDVRSEFDEGAAGSFRHAIHRDEYYMFMFLESVDGVFIVDFEEIRLGTTGYSVFYVRPGQAHYAKSLMKTKGWYMIIDPVLVEKEYRNIFEKQFFTQQPIGLDVSVRERLLQAVHLLQSSMEAEPTAFSHKITLSLANVFIGTIAELYAGSEEIEQRHKSRAAQIAHQFKALLDEKYKTIKSPIQYAQNLNYSLSHLNDSVKSITGFPVSYWIQQQVVLEAKRLLYYTDIDVKEIAFSLGYEDHTYFSRLFTKVVGVSPGAFRRKFHE